LLNSGPGRARRPRPAGSCGSLASGLAAIHTIEADKRSSRRPPAHCCAAQAVQTGAESVPSGRLRPVRHYRRQRVADAIAIAAAYAGHNDQHSADVIDQGDLVLAVEAITRAHEDKIAKCQATFAALELRLAKLQ